MPTNHDAVAALPTNDAADKALLRNLVTKRMAYVFADADDPTDFVAVDPDTGAATIDVIYLGRVFHYDPTDLLTEHDGTTCIVSDEGRRYKLAAGTDVFAYSVLSRSLAAPPVSPALGDAFLVAAAATGDWAGHSGEVAVYTIREWEFIDFGIGRLIYVEDIDSYYHKDSGGNWLAGFGAQTLSANAVPLSAAINFGKRLIVENQTTTAPPASPTVGTAYIIGASATGDWAGQDGKIAICEVAGEFVIYTVTNGWAAYDKATNKEYIFNGTAWVPSLGAWIARGSVFTAAALSNHGGFGTYSYSNTVAPTLSVGLCKDTVTLAWTARQTGAKLRFHYDANVSTGGNGVYVMALFRDAVATALDWRAIGVSFDSTCHSVEFEIAAPDALAHTYFVAVLDGPGGAVASVARRLFTVMEASS